MHYSLFFSFIICCFFHALFTVFFICYLLFFSHVIHCFFSLVICCFFHTLFVAFFMRYLLLFSLIICCFFHSLFTVFLMKKSKECYIISQMCYIRMYQYYSMGAWGNQETEHRWGECQVQESICVRWLGSWSPYPKEITRRMLVACAFTDRHAKYHAAGARMVLVPVKCHSHAWPCR